MSTGVVSDRGRGVPQASHRVLRRAADAFGQDEATAGALFHTAVRRYVAGRHRRGRPGQQPGRDAHRARAIRRPPRAGHRHAYVCGILRGAQAVRRTSAGQAAAAAARVHRDRVRNDAVHSAVDFRMKRSAGRPKHP